MKMTQVYYTSHDLVDRLCSAATNGDRSVTFLVGSALSLPDHVGGHGVPGVSGMVDLIRNEFKDSDAASEFDQGLNGESATRYRQAFELLYGRRGPGVANRLVRTAVWQALDTSKLPSHLVDKSPHNADSDTCKALEGEVNAWVLPRAADLFGSLLVTVSDTFGGAVLTTNFDPLIEVSILKHHGRFYRTVLHDDGKLGQTIADGTHVVHLHGYWWGYDTLHMPQQLNHSRPQLRQSLARVVEASTLVVIGYGGWDDVVTRTLVDLLSDSTRTPEIMWAFYGDDPTTIEASNRQLLAALAPGIGRGRVSLYRGIDCCTVLSEIHERVKPRHPSSDLTKWRRMQRQVKAESDSPLFVDPWVGREQELNILTSSVAQVAFVTGLGGQGKSALVGHFLQQQALAPGGRFDFWDWRDCREESDRLSTQILRLVGRMSTGAIDASQIEVNNIRAVVGILFHVLRDRRALLVFDNVDQYVDLETLQPVKGLDVLVAEAQIHSHHSLFLFTCRPDVRVDESRVARIPLAGLTADETKELIAARGVPQKDLHLAEELHRRTDGHPLWMNLVAMQAVRYTRNGLDGALDLIGKGGAKLPDTTRTIWHTLNEQQRDVLRTMAELDRPESESRLLDVLPGVNVNRVNRALKALRSFHLIEIRAQQEGEPLLGLHPIIREFVRTNFPMRDREKYVGPIFLFLGKMIGRFKVLLPKEPSYEILEYWIRKADLEITFRRFEEATSTIAEITRPLINRGYSEEMIRLTRRLLGELDWAEACSSYKDFDAVFERCLTAMIEFGHDAFKVVLMRYENAIPGESSQFVLLCDLWCYADWYAGEYDSAIQWGEKGDRLKERTAVDTRFSTGHHLALARRDAGRVPEAIERFLEGESLDAVVAAGEWIEGKGASYYGNIGRCLFLTGQLDKVLGCYIKSARLLEEGRTHWYRINRGYIRYWIAELLMAQGEFEGAAASYRAAVCMWNESSPPRAVQAKDKLEALAGRHPGLRMYLDAADWKVEDAFGQWLGRQ